MADEVNVKGYEIERSVNGIQFISIGFVNANGKSVYTFADNDAAAIPFITVLEI
ncbi:MAG: hypothetical protein ABR503_05885 [Chitinophagaceae bacterium]